MFLLFLLISFIGSSLLCPIDPNNFPIGVGSDRFVIVFNPLSNLFARTFEMRSGYEVKKFEAIAVFAYVEL